MDVYKGLGVFALGVGFGLVFPLVVYWQQQRDARHKAQMAMTCQQLDYIPHGGPCPGPYPAPHGEQWPDGWYTHAWVEATEHEPAHWVEIDVGTWPARVTAGRV